MVNPHAGEVAATLNGEPHVLKLTLGSLAELEHRLEEGCFVDMVERFESGTYSPRDVMAIVVAGLRGGGWKGAPEDLIDAEIGEGPMDAAKIAGLLLTRAFAMPPPGGA